MSTRDGVDTPKSFSLSFQIKCISVWMWGWGGSEGLGCLRGELTLGESIKIKISLFHYCIAPL